jgi:hypothetical protein
MLALYRSGRRADALTAYRQLYARLDGDLGIEPRRPVSSLHDRMLRADPALLDAAAPEPGATAVHEEGPRTQITEERSVAPPGGTTDPRRVPAPSQLPLDVADFTGREGYLKELAALIPASEFDDVRTMLIAAINGTAGVGKTALAVHWAHQVAGRFPDGQLYIDLRGYSQTSPVSPAEALAMFLRAIGIPGPQIPGDVAEAAAMFRSQLAGKRVLVVLDNAGNADHVRPLLPGGPGCLVVITSRDRLGGLTVTHGAQRIPRRPV